MGKGKAKKRNDNVTKIDPSTFEQKPFAVSHHAARDGTRVTSVVKPIRKPSTFQEGPPVAFSAATSEFEGDYLEDDCSGDDASRGYYVARVCIPSPFSFYMR